MTTPVQVLVIGSGFGGAISASRIAEAGFKVKILERGPWRDSVPVRSMGIRERAPFPLGRHRLTKLIRTIRNPRLPGGSLTFNKLGFFEVYVGKGLNMLCSSQVGGGSHAYGALNMRPPEPGYWDQVGLGDGAMDKHYQSVMRRMGSTIPKPEHLGNSVRDLFKNSDLLASDESVTVLPMGFLFPKNPDNPAEILTEDGVTRQEVRLGHEMLGSPGGGKTTLDFAYLARAIKQHGLEVCDLREATVVKPSADGEPGRYRVSARNLRTGQTERHYAEQVIVAAGTLNTLDLLLRSREAEGGIRGMPQLGKRFCANGDFMAFCRVKKGQTLNPSVPVDGLVKIKDGAGNRSDRPWPLIVLSAFSTQGLPLPRFIKRLFPGSLLLAGMGKDSTEGSARLKNGKLVIDYDPNRSRIYEDIRSAFALVGKELGSKIRYVNRPTTSHQTGGACVGSSIEEGVVDLDGEVFGCPGLYVCDGAALPGPVGGPPSITIGAWAEHVAERFIARQHHSVEPQLDSHQEA